MDQSIYIIKFGGVSTAEANQFASELRNALLDATPDIRVDQKRNDNTTQDFGSVLVLILGTSSVTAIARALGNWLQLRSSASLTIKSSERKIIATNITSKDAAKLIELLVTKE